MNVEDEKSLVGNVIAFTLAVIALICVITCAILSLFLPKTYGDLLFSVGFKNASLSAYEYNYQTTNDIDDLYLLLIRSISAKNDEFIVKSYDNLKKREEYNEFILYVEQKNWSKCSSILEMLYLSNEDNYLKGKYTIALKNFKGSDVAFGYAYEELKNSEVTTSAERVNYVMGYYIGELKQEEDFEYITNDVKNDIYEYFDSLYQVYQNEFANLNTNLSPSSYSVLKFNLLKLNRKIIEVYYSMELIEKYVGMGQDMQSLREIANRLSREYVNLLR